MTKSGRTVGVVGAGVAGLVCARELAANGFDVQVFEKSRGPGGRTATRRADPNLEFDHGAQYFTARDPRFREATADWLARGVAAEWTGRVVRLEDGTVTDTSAQPRYVGAPGMSAIAADLAVGRRVRTHTRVVAAVRGSTGWTIATESHEQLGPFDTLVVTLPAPQAAELLGSHPFGAVSAAVSMSPCWAVMVAFQSRFPAAWDGAFVHGSPLSWVARNSSKPSRVAQSDCWVLHAVTDWSSAHLEATPHDAARELLGAFCTAVGQALPSHHHLVAHRWRYSHGADPAQPRMLFDREAGLVVCGDWLAGERVEGAFLSGLAAAQALVDADAAH